MLVDLSPIPTIAFLVTDAEPHLASARPTPTSSLELKWLGDRNVPRDVASDIYRLFDSVISSYSAADSHLFLNCIVYGNSSARRTYAPLVQRTGGLLMEPRSRDPRLLCAGMMAVVNSLLARLSAAESESANDLSGFVVYDASGMLCSCERDSSRVRDAPVGDAATLFRIAMDRIVAVCGRKWAKRAISISAPAEQLEFVWRALRYVAAPAPSPAEAADLQALRDRVILELPPSSKGHFSIEVSDLDKLKQLAHASGGVQSSVSLETVRESLEDEPDVGDWLATFMPLLTGYAQAVRLPLDRDGKPDFMDAWSAVTARIGCDRMTPADFMRMAGGASDVTGPTDRQGYNAFLVMVPQSDGIATAALNIASGTQVLDFVTGVAMGAKGFLPNLYAGMASSTLMHLLSGDLGPFRREQAAQLVHALRTLCRDPAPAAGAQLARGVSNPADPLSKLVAAAARLEPALGGSSARLVIEEWAAAMVQRHYGKGPEADAEYLGSIRRLFPADAIFINRADNIDIDPLSQLHPLEEASEPQMLPRWLQDACARVRAERFCHVFERGASALLDLLLGRTLRDTWPDWESGMVLAVLLRSRTARYRKEGEGTEVVWHSLGTPPMLPTLLGRLREAEAERLRVYRDARRSAARRMLLDTALDSLQRLLGHPDPEDQAVGVLRALAHGPAVSVMGVGAHLDRMAVPELLEAALAWLSPPLLRALVRGAWTTVPPNALRKCALVKQLAADLGAPDVLESVQAHSSCMRARPNRLGHSATVQYPGPCGWTEEYQQARITANPGRARYLVQMKSFTTMAMEITGRAEQCGMGDEVRAVLHSYNDANDLERARSEALAILCARRLAVAAD